MFLDACHDLSALRLWMLNGGHATLSSFGVEDCCDIPLHYRQFCARLPYYRKLDDFVLVHAGINVAAADPFSDLEAMLWSRSMTMDRKRLGGRRLVCGHTPVGRDEIKSSMTGDLIDLDNGCVYRQPGLGALAALELNSMSLVFQENID
jgi:serine/threonine protein phosphatase 1